MLESLKWKKIVTTISAGAKKPVAFPSKNPGSVKNRSKEALPLSTIDRFLLADCTVRYSRYSRNCFFNENAIMNTSIPGL